MAHRLMLVKRFSFLLIIALMTPFNLAAEQADSTLAPGTPSPTFYRRDVNQQDVDLKRWQTQKDDAGPLVITFFASWCKACKKSAPLLTSTVRKYHQSHKLRLIAIGVGESKAAVRDYMNQYFGISPNAKEKGVYPLSDRRRGLAKKFGVIDATGNASLPVTYIVDRHGTVRAVLKDKTAERLEAEVQGVLTTP